MCPDPKIGLAQGLLPALDRFDAPFIAILGDEIYLDTNHSYSNASQDLRICERLLADNGLIVSR